MEIQESKQQHIYINGKRERDCKNFCKMIFLHVEVVYTILLKNDRILEKQLREVNHGISA